MTEPLDSGWWRCNCTKDCGCKDGRRPKLNPPSLARCDDCGEDRPGKTAEWSAEDHRARRQAVLDSNAERNGRVG